MQDGDSFSQCISCLVEPVVFGGFVGEFLFVPGGEPLVFGFCFCQGLAESGDFLDVFGGNGPSLAGKGATVEVAVG